MGVLGNSLLHAATPGLGRRPRLRRGVQVGEAGEEDDTNEKASELANCRPPG